MDDSALAGEKLSLSDKDLVQILEVLPCGNAGFRQDFALKQLHMGYNRYKCTENDEVKCKPIILSCLVQWRDKDSRNNASALVRLLDEASEHGPVSFPKSGYAFLQQRCLEGNPSFRSTQEYPQGTSSGQTSDGNNDQPNLRWQQRSTQRGYQGVARTRKVDQKPYDRKTRGRTNISSGRQTSSANEKVSIPYPGYGKYILTRFVFCPGKVYFCLMGCRKKLGKIPPNDLVVATRRKKGRKISNYYFHFNEECLKKIDPHFTMDLIELSDDIKEHLTDEHWEILRRHNVG